MELDYQPPFDNQLELHIIGAMISDPECITDIVEIIKPKFFYSQKNSRVYEKIVEVWSEDERNVDLKLILPIFHAEGMELSGVLEAARSIYMTADITQYCDRLKDLAALRAAGKIGAELIKATTHRDKDDIRGAISSAELKLSKLNEATIRTDTMADMKTAVLEFHEEFEKTYYNSDSGVTGLTSGIRDFDDMTAGLQKSDLIVLGARPSMGKTSLGQQIALNVSLLPDASSGEPVFFVSLEQAKKQLVRRGVANKGMIDLSRLNSGMIDPDEWEKYTMALGVLGNANLVIDDQAGLTVNEIRAKARKVKRERGLSLIVIDYLGKIRAPDPRMSRYDAVSENVRLLKDMAKEFDIPVICLAQLSRAVEQRADKRPVISDLRESGEIEQEADIIGFLYRDDYYNAESTKKGITELIIAKHRNGPTGLVEMVFLKQFNKFVNLDRGNSDAEQLAFVWVA